MKKKHVVKALATAILLVNCMALSAAEAIKHMSYLKAVKLGSVSVSGLVSNGGYMGKCLSLSLHNNTKAPLVVKVNPALIFMPDDSQYQNLVAVGEEEISINPGETTTQSIQTFCGKSYAHSPRANINYRFLKQGDSTMIKASVYINRHKLYSSTGQAAIWMFTNKHPLSNVYSYWSNQEESKQFVAFLAKITHQPVPEVYTYHQINNRSDGAVYSNAASKVYVNMEWKGEFRRNVRLAILDKDRKVYQEITDGEIINSNGEHLLRVVFDLKTTPQGIYYVQLRDDDNKVWLEKNVVIDKNL